MIALTNGYSSIFGGFASQREQLAARRAEAQTELEKARAEKERIRRIIKEYRTKEPVPKTRQFAEREAWITERPERIAREKREALKRGEAIRLETKVIPEILKYEQEVAKYQAEIAKHGIEIGEQEAKIRKYKAKGYKVVTTPGGYEFYEKIEARVPPRATVVTVGSPFGQIRMAKFTKPLIGIEAALKQKAVWEVITGKRLPTGEPAITPERFLIGIPIEQWKPEWKEKYLQPRRLELGPEKYRLKSIFGEVTVSRVELPEKYQYKIEQAPIVYTPKGPEYANKIIEYKYVSKADVDPLYWSKKEMKKIQRAYKIPIVGGVIGTVAEYGFGAVSTFAALGRPVAEFAAVKAGVKTKPVHYVSPLDVALEPIGLAPTGATEFIKKHPVFAAGGIAGETLQMAAITKGIGYAGKGIKIGVGKAWAGALRYTGTKPIEIFWAKTKIVGAVQKFTWKRGLISPVGGKLTTKVFFAKSKALGAIQKFAYKRGLLDPTKSSRLFWAKSRALGGIQKFARERGLISTISPPGGRIRWGISRITGRGLFKAGEVTVPYPGYQAGRVRGVWGTYPTRETKELWTATYEPYQEMQTLIYPKEGLIPERAVYWKKPRGYVGYDTGDVARQIETITGKAPSLLELERMQYSVMRVGRGIEAMPSAGYYAKYGQIQTKVRFERYMGFYGLPEVPMVSVTTPTIKGVGIKYEPSKRIQDLIKPEVELRPMKYYKMPDVPFYKAIPEYKLIPKITKYAPIEELGLPTGFQPIGKVTTGVKEWLKTKYYQRFLPPSQVTLGYPFEIGKIAGIEKIAGKRIITRTYIEEARIEALGLKAPIERISTTTGWRDYLARKDWFVVGVKPKRWGITPWQFIKTEEVVKTSTEDIGKSVLRLVSKTKEVSKVRFPVKHVTFNIRDFIAIEKLEEGIPIGVSKYWTGAISAPPILKRITTGALVPALAVDTGKITGDIKVQVLGEKVKPRYEFGLIALTKPSFDVFRETIQPSLSATLQGQGMVQAQTQVQMQAQLQTQMQKLKMPPFLIPKLVFSPKPPPKEAYGQPSPPPPYTPPYEPPPTHRPPIIPPLLLPEKIRRKKKKKKKELYIKKYRFRKWIVPDPLKGMKKLEIKPPKIKAIL